MGGEFTRKRDRLSYEERGWHPALYICDRLMRVRNSGDRPVKGNPTLTRTLPRSGDRS
ncbi:hypothetical protein J0895_08045 [Phormidium pseudopriestleyi FRX01]|uniref:Transposase n=1 Tax=Phormidium pseudopriestleyi FRX01 TaxID=1759528 RepID=A0ABS3FQ96_9CYAN|nr:hypothetical protein [Phormidium pseudopriestleyi]MBO0349052.1 hypothetical protein [Phormidium pseudopriestleyi FRX01]